jgi:lipopolysaccharide transport system permease protein
MPLRHERNLFGARHYHGSGTARHEGKAIAVDGVKRGRLDNAPTGERAVDRPLTVIEPTRGWVPLNLRELWRAHELLYFFVWRDVKVRYKQTAIGAAWAIVQPLVLMLLFTVLFSRVGNVSSEGLPYPVFAYAGLLPWTFFATSLLQSSRSLVGNQNLITKVYFPRIALPIAAVLAAMFDLAVASTLLVGLMLVYGIAPDPTVIFVPVFVLLAAATALGVGTWLAAVNVKYRDVQYVVPFLLQVWILATPIAYSADALPDDLEFLAALNPMTSVVEGFRWAIFGTSGVSAAVFACSLGLALVLFVSGLFYFKRTERSFADVV